MQFFTFITIGLGGAIGAITRVAMAKVLPEYVSAVPAYILCINIIGCFLMGLLAEIMSLHWPLSENMRYFLISGFLGGFTTFSAFALEFGLLFQKNQHFLALLYAALSFIFSIGAFFVGSKIVRVFS